MATASAVPAIRCSTRRPTAPNSTPRNGRPRTRRAVSRIICDRCRRTSPNGAPRSISTRPGTPPRGSGPRRPMIQTAGSARCTITSAMQRPRISTPCRISGARLPRPLRRCGQRRRIRAVSQRLRALSRQGEGGTARAHPADRPRTPRPARRRRLRALPDVRAEPAIARRADGRTRRRLRPPRNACSG